MIQLADRGQFFVEPGEDTYEGQVVGINPRAEDLDVNVTREKKLTNMRSSTADVIETLARPLELDLEQAMEFCADDECVEVTPEIVRVRKVELDATTARPSQVPRQGPRLRSERRRSALAERCSSGWRRYPEQRAETCPTLCDALVELVCADRRWCRRLHGQPAARTAEHRHHRDARHRRHRRRRRSSWPSTRSAPASTRICCPISRR